MDPTLSLTYSDKVVLESFFRDIRGSYCGEDDNKSVQVLRSHNEPQSERFTPTVFTTWDDKDIPDLLNEYCRILV